MNHLRLTCTTCQQTPASLTPPSSRRPPGSRSGGASATLISLISQSEVRMLTHGPIRRSQGFKPRRRDLCGTSVACSRNEIDSNPVTPTLSSQTVAGPPGSPVQCRVLGWCCRREMPPVLPCPRGHRPIRGQYPGLLITSLPIRGPHSRPKTPTCSSRQCK